MKKMFILIPVFIAFSAMAQKPAYTAPEMPVDPETKLITYSKVVDIPNTSAKELYRRGEAWMMATFKNPNEVIRERDSAASKIVAKPRFKITNEPNEVGVRSDAGIVSYTLTLACRDNKIKYTLSEINWKQASVFPAERWVEQKDRYKQNNYYLWQTDSMMQKVIGPDMVKALKTVPVKKKDDW